MKKLLFGLLVICSPFGLFAQAKEDFGKWNFYKAEYKKASMSGEKIVWNVIQSLNDSCSITIGEYNLEPLLVLNLKYVVCYYSIIDFEELDGSYFFTLKDKENGTIWDLVISEKDGNATFLKNNWKEMKVLYF